MDANGLLESLLSLARNHQWTFSRPHQAVFEALPGFDAHRHPVQLVSGLEPRQLESLLADPSFTDRLESLADLSAEPLADPEIAYFSPEFGLTDLVPQYSGGLGILAGDHLKASSDLGLSLCGVGLFYGGGFFRQTIEDGGQHERYEEYLPEDLGCVDCEIEVTIPMGPRNVTARVWRLDVGRVPLLLLDTDVEANAPNDRRITDRLYSGDHRHRLEQELVLGVGGVRALSELGWAPPVIHLNEGHAGFLVLELLDRHLASGHTLDESLSAIRSRLVFTTHTPVPAGIDRFEPDLARSYLTPWADRWGIPTEELLDLGADPNDEPSAFNMAALCLRAAGRSNGVSRLHGAVSRRLFADIPGGADIGSVTNGVHARTWVAPRLQETLDTVLGPTWADGDVEAWQKVDNIDDETVRSLRRAGSRDLQALIADRTGNPFDPDALIVGFARRFATYKRATLLLHHRQQLAELLDDRQRPLQFVFAGKAHPADRDGKALLADIIAFSTAPESRGRFLFVPDYDVAVAKAMYAGCDVWLNNPVRPHEASGTSGEKSALNGGLNCSISDGWWDEMADGSNGWTIPASTATNDETRDREESQSALALLAGEILPEYYDGGGSLSPAWIDRIRHCWRTLGPQVTAARMVAEYRDRLYQPTLDAALRP